MAYKLKVEFTWGHQSRIIGLSKSNPSFYYPPPTTILGALAEVLAKRYELGEKPETSRKLIANLSKKLLALGLRPLNTIPLKYMDLNRIIAVKITRGIHYPSPKDLAGSFDAPARGKTIMSPLTEESPTIEILMVLRDDEFKFNGKKIVVDKEFLWDIHRLGSRESIVSVVDVDYSDKIESLHGVVATRYSFPVMSGVSIEGEIKKRWIYEIYVNPFDLREDQSILDYYLKGENTIAYKVPLMIVAREYPVIRVRVDKPMTAYKVFFKQIKTIIIGREG